MALQPRPRHREEEDEGALATGVDAGTGVLTHAEAAKILEVYTLDTMQRENARATQAEDRRQRAVAFGVAKPRATDAELIDLKRRLALVESTVHWSSRGFWAGTSSLCECSCRNSWRLVWAFIRLGLCSVIAVGLLALVLGIDVIHHGHRH